MAQYAIKIGEMKLVSDELITTELRAVVLKAVREALATMDGKLGNGCTLEFEVVDD